MPLLLQLQRSILLLWIDDEMQNSDRKCETVDFPFLLSLNW